MVVSRCPGNGGVGLIPGIHRLLLVFVAGDISKHSGASIKPKTMWQKYVNIANCLIGKHWNRDSFGTHQSTTTKTYIINKKTTSDLYTYIYICM